MSKLFKHLQLAVTYLTVLPCSPKEEIHEEDWARSIKFFSTVGIIFGLTNFFALELLKLIFDLSKQEFLTNSFLVALVLCLAGYILSGGLHLDGLMDSFDGIGSGKTDPKEIKEVMRDSRVGAFGAMAGFLVIATKLVSIASIAPEKLGMYILLVPFISRLMTVFAIAFQPYQGYNAKSSSSFKKHLKLPEDIIFNLLPLLAIVACVLAKFYSLGNMDSFWEIIQQEPQLVLLDILLPLSSYLCFLWLARKLKGHSGDSYGAGIEMSEALNYLLIAILV